MAQPAGDIQRSFGHYEVESVLGRGAMGMVYLARDRRIGRRVALKTVHVEERFDDESEANEFYKRLQREAELCGALQHPNIVTLYEPGYENNVIAWLATEYVDGESLRDRLKKRKPLAVAEAVRISCDILRGLAFAHGKGIIHRDIKPANILLTKKSEAKIADFGIARPMDSNLTAAGEMLGTPSYMSPEQVKCTAVTARSDLFSVGSVMYELLTGVKAFAASDVSSILKNVVDMEAKPLDAVNPAVPPPLSAFVLRLLAKSPDARFPSAGAALTELEKIGESLGLLDDPVEEELPPAPPAEPPAAVDTLAGASPAMAPTFDDLTPAIGSRATEKMVDRPIPTAVAVGTIVLLLTLLGSAVAAIRMQTDSAPTVRHTPEQLREFAEKREALGAARVLFAAGEYQSAIEEYNQYLDRYPNSVAAMQGRDAAYAALDEQSKTKITVTAKKPAKKPAQKPAPPAKKPWFRRIFGS
jgi:tRNA A-37 threonylcarbamoyl transferase component Bud32